MATDDTQQIGRLAMREEGQNWNAYYAMSDTMKDAVFLGSIPMAAIADNEARKHAFMVIMRDFVADIIEEKIGVRPTWGGATAAPEHERAGSA